MRNFKTLLIMATLLLACFNLNAQIEVRTNGNVRIGVPVEDEDTYAIAHPDNADTITTVKIYGPNGFFRAGARLSFGDAGSLSALNVMVGEAGNGIDTDQLWLHGKHGFYVTAATTAGDTVMFYDRTKGNYLQVNSDVRSTGIFIASDNKFKENVEPIESTLSDLSELVPVSYKLKSFLGHDAVGLHKAPQNVTSEKQQKDALIDAQFNEESAKSALRYGFLAQNVLEVFPDLVHSDEKGNMYVDYIGLIPILVQCVNELQAKVDELTQEDVSSTPLRARQTASTTKVASDRVMPELKQNRPNPFSSSTTIEYVLPEDVVDAAIYIYDMQGKQVRKIQASERGASSVQISGYDLPAGMYIYSLIADGQEIASKRMILTK